MFKHCKFLFYRDIFYNLFNSSGLKVFNVFFGCKQPFNTWLFEQRSIILEQIEICWTLFNHFSTRVYTIIRTYEFHTTQYLVKRQHIHISTFWTERERTTEWLHTTLFTKIVNREKFKETDYQFKVINISCWYVSSRLLCKHLSQ